MTQQNLAPALMFQGTGSDVGKSLLVAGLCRALTNQGLKVRPFKPQNMSNNAAVTPDGGEIGRAQALQALACRVEPSVHMNPVLLKPEADNGSQIVVQGKVFGTAKARDYYKLKPQLLDRVIDSFNTLRAEADIVLVEGAGSAAEVNLRKGDIANMGFALATQTPVVLIGDIDRGGVIASLVGTANLLPPEEKALVQGYLINKFRGDASLFDDGLNIITEQTGWQSFGVIPYFNDAKKLPAEDGVALEKTAPRNNAGAVKIAIPRLPRIANFDDFDPLAAEPQVDLVYVQPGSPLPQDAHCLILPGSKATRADLAFLKSQGWDIDIRAHHRQGKPVMGICGGYQMLGTWVHDPKGIEGPAGSEEGLGLLNVETTLNGDKTVTQSHGTHQQSGSPVSGYEIHSGITTGPDTAKNVITLQSGPDGALSNDGLISGCYLHGIFASDKYCKAFLRSLSSEIEVNSHYSRIVEQVINDLASHLESTTNILEYCNKLLSKS